MNLTYSVDVTEVGFELQEVTVQIKDGETLIKEGKTHVAGTAEQAAEYAETVFLPDLRRNFPRELGSLVLASEVVVEESEAE